MLKIEKPGIADIKEASDLAEKIYLKYNSNMDTNEGIKNVISFINNIQMRLFLEGSLILTAKNNNIIIGMIEITHYNNISLFFVDDNHFKKGIASSLFNEVKNILNSDQYTVKSSEYALEFYKKLGFIQIYNDIQMKNGVHFHFMIY